MQAVIRYLHAKGNYPRIIDNKIISDYVKDVMTPAVQQGD